MKRVRTKQKLLIRNTQAPGDVTVLSAMIRDLHRCHPGKFDTAVSVAPGAGHVFYENPFISSIAERRQPKTPGYTQFVAHYPLIKRSNQERKHFIWGFIEDANKRLHTRIKLTEFRPDIYMSDNEIAHPPFEQPYWVFLSGGKSDFKTKIWDQTYWQDVIRQTADRISFYS